MRTYEVLESIQPRERARPERILPHIYPTEQLVKLLGTFARIPFATETR